MFVYVALLQIKLCDGRIFKHSLLGLICNDHVIKARQIDLLSE